jgi:drug/metabolite transporter (DMT)-like permease
MTGILMALVAGVGFGIFQAVNRRANQLIDAYRGTFRLLLLAVTILGAVSIATQDLAAVGDAPIGAFVAFAGAGIVHFFFGWTFLGLSQQRIGASRTGVAVAATPLIASVIAALALDEPFPPLTVVGVLATVLGVALIATRAGNSYAPRSEIPWFGLGSALCWGSSPLLIRWGLSGLPIPLFGVTIGLAAAAALYAVVLAAGIPAIGGSSPRAAMPWLTAAAIIMGTATTSQWIAFDLIEISIAVTLMQVATPVVVSVAPIIVGSDMERITGRLVAGMIAVVGGSVVVVLTGGG